ncbi:MAG: hypothetical protein M1499_00755 [Firmicutes bacterium]|nr:hypothetical protein [Bacillota bacterium]MCL5971077.1 hypothetical protein [Bacillota bacterium]
MEVQGLTKNNNNPVVEQNAKETDNRIKNGTITVTAPAGHVTFNVIDNKDPITVSVSPLDILEFRACLPLAQPSGARLLTGFTLEETIVALALWHIEHTSYEPEEGHFAMVQPADVMFVEQNLRDWVKTFERASAMLKSISTNGSDKSSGSTNK